MLHGAVTARCAQAPDRLQLQPPDQKVTTTAACMLPGVPMSCRSSFLPLLIVASHTDLSELCCLLVCPLQKLKPEYSSAATTLNAHDASIVIGKVRTGPLLPETVSFQHI